MQSWRAARDFGDRRLRRGRAAISCRNAPPPRRNPAAVARPRSVGPRSVGPRSACAGPRRDSGARRPAHRTAQHRLPVGGSARIQPGALAGVQRSRRQVVSAVPGPRRRAARQTPARAARHQLRRRCLVCDPPAGHRSTALCEGRYAARTARGALDEEGRAAVPQRPRGFYPRSQGRRLLCQPEGALCARRSTDAEGR